MSQRNAVFKYAKDRYGTEPDYLWPQYPGYAVLRHDADRRWYAIVMDVARKKLGIDGDGQVDVIDVKCRPERIETLRGKKGFLPAYHMNKRHWISILLDGSVPLEEIYKCFDESYGLTRHA